MCLRVTDMMMILLLNSAFDPSSPVCQVDVRTPEGSPLRWPLSADTEALIWHPHQPTSFLVSAEDGVVACFDARAGAGGLSVALHPALGPYGV